MINRIPAAARHFTDMGWLKTYWLFSFSNYYDPENVQYGALRVFNDDVVLSDHGFSTHPHEEMEIVSIVLNGEMRHQDTMGNTSVIKENDVQRMTAGTGLYHSEWNHGEQPVHFCQIWIMPDRNGLKPSYDQKSFTPDTWENTLALLAANDADSHGVQLNTDAKIYRARMENGRSINHSVVPGRKIFIYQIEGSAIINGQALAVKDQARISDEQHLQIDAGTETDFLLIDIPD